MASHGNKRAVVFALGLLIATIARADEPAAPAAAVATDDLDKMSLEELLNVDVRSAAGLTAIGSTRMLPVDMTQLDARDIQQSGVRDINHLVEAYVPNAQLIHHHYPQDHLGFRGIISDREDKYLYQVNGLTLNNRMLLGADNERAIPLLGDIHSLDVVRGPASATHGAGALAGVIGVNTYTGLTFQGVDLSLRQGFVDEYTAGEIRWGHKFNDESGLFLYYGIAHVDGADSSYNIGHSFPATNGLPENNAGQPYGGPMANLGEAGFDAPWQKAHLSYVAGPLQLWVRFVQDGAEARPNRDIYTTVKPPTLPVEEWTRGREIKNRQATAAAEFKKELSPEWSLDLLQSYGIWLLDDRRAGVSVGRPERHAYEQQLFSRAIADWKPVAGQDLAFGVEYAHEWIYDPPQSDALDRAPVVNDRAWQTDTISFLAEDQWKINNQWTTFLSFRTDKNTYSDWLLSPRGTLVYTPTKLDTWKLMAGQSVRRGADEELWGEWERSGTIPDPETLITYELSYERKVTDDWTAGINGFYEDYDAIGWIPSLLQSSSIGQFQIAGGEVVVGYRTKTTRFTFSEGISTLVDSDVPASLPAAGQGITSEPYGFGHQLANWSPAITKLAVIHDLSSKWTVSSSLIYYYGFPGAEDYAAYANTLATVPSGVPFSDPGYNRPYGPNIFLNMGLEFHPSKNWKLRFDAYNLYWLVDHNQSKRNYILRASEYSEEPAAVAISVGYKF